MANRRATVKLNGGVRTTRAQQAADFSRKKAKIRAQSRKRRRMGLGVLAVIIFGLLNVTWLNYTGRLEAFQTAYREGVMRRTASAGFAVKQVYLVGRRHADRAMVQAALQVQPNDPTLGLDLPAMQARLEKIPEIKTAILVRRLPNALYVRLVERRPVAIWQRAGDYMLVDADGSLLSREKYPHVKGLPVLVGADAPKHVQEFSELLETVPSLKQEVVAAVRVGERRWNIRLKRDITVLLPEMDPKAAWKHFAELVRSEALLSKAIRSVDMRMEDRVFITPVDQGKTPLTLTGAAKDT